MTGRWPTLLKVTTPSKTISTVFSKEMVVNLRDKVVKNFIISNCIKFGHFRLRSGQTSDVYIDKFILESNPSVLYETARLMIQNLPRVDYDVVVGLELGGIPVATIISQITKTPMALLRKNTKEYGTANMVEGATIENKRLLVIEDIVTSGGQIIEAAERLIQAGGRPVLASSIILREKQGKTNIKNKTGIDLSYAFEYGDLFKQEA